MAGKKDAAAEYDSIAGKYAKKREEMASIKIIINLLSINPVRGV